MSRRLLILAAVLLFLPAPAMAQRLSSGYPPSLPFSPPLAHHAGSRVAASDSVRIPPTHWEAGALMGLFLGAGMGVAIAQGFCNMSENPDHHCAPTAYIGGAFIVGAVGFTIGGLIGGAIPADSAGSGVPR